MKAFFFDRDGVINHVPINGKRYIESWDEFNILPEFVAALRRVTEAGYVAVVITNQRCVGRGIVSRETLESMHQRLRAFLSDEHGLSLLDIEYCPHAEDGCACRKPEPGMILAAAERHGIDLAASWMVGDHGTDVRAGQAAGCKTIYLGDESGVDADHCLPDISGLESLIAEIVALR